MSGVNPVPKPIPTIAIAGELMSTPLTPLALDVDRDMACAAFECARCLIGDLSAILEWGRLCAAGEGTDRGTLFGAGAGEEAAAEAGVRAA